MDFIVNNMQRFALSDVNSRNFCRETSMENLYPQVLEVLTKATSQKTSDIKPAEQQLKLWENKPGFYNVLLTIYLDSSLDTNVRWLAVLLCKHGVERYWRFSACHSISQEERIKFRGRLLTNLKEPNFKLAVQHAILVGKVARYDCPSEWPDLVPSLVQLVQQSSEVIVQRHALLVLHHVIKSLCSKRLAGDRRLFQQLAADIFPFMLQVWVDNVKQFFELTTNPTAKLPEAILSLEKARFCLKGLRKLLIYGYKEPHLHQKPVELVTLLFQQLKPLLECRQCFKEQEHLRDLLEKSLVLIQKILDELLELHPFSFVNFIKPTLQMCVSLCFTAEGEAYLFPKFTIQSLNLIKAILLCDEYKPPKQAQVDFDYVGVNPLTLEAKKIKDEFFTMEMLSEIFVSLLSKYFPLTQADFASWEEDPESYAGEQIGESWKFSLRPCAETLFLTIMKENREHLLPLLVDFLKKVQAIDQNATMEQLLQKEAVYTAVGLAAFELYDEIDFDAWFKNTLMNEIKYSNDNMKFLKRRVAWLLGQWVGVRLAAENRPLLYEALIPLLGQQEDTVVRMTAANTLKIALDDFEFNVEQFLPYLESTVGLLFTLLKDLAECDAKLSVLGAITQVVEQVGGFIQPYASSLIHYLPLLWGSCGDHNMLRCAIITNLIRLVDALGIKSEEIHSFLLPIISISTDIEQPCCVYLLEDGLELWTTTVHNASQGSQELLLLVSHIFPLLDTTVEYFKKYFQIFLASFVLMPNEFLQVYGNKVVEVCINMISDLKSEDVLYILKLAETVIKVFPQEGTQLFSPLVMKLLQILMDSKKFSYLSMTSQTNFLVIISRLVIHNSSLFSKIIKEYASQVNKEPERVLQHLLLIWIDKLPLANPLTRQKLLALALTSLLSTNLKVIHELINGIIITIVEVLHDLEKMDDHDGLASNQTAKSDCLLMSQEGDAHIIQEFDCEHELRIYQLSKQDPVHTVPLKDYLNSQLLQVYQGYGEDNFWNLMSGLDAETQQQLKHFLEPIFLK